MATGQLRLPDDKLRHLRALLRDWGSRRSCTRKELESLIGLLNHACKVVRPGRSFLERMLDLLHSVHCPPNSPVPLRLNQGFHADLAWWRWFLERWNGVSFLLSPVHLPRIEMTIDASCSWGMAQAVLVPGAVGSGLTHPDDSRLTNHPAFTGIIPQNELVSR